MMIENTQHTAMAPETDGGAPRARARGIVLAILTAIFAFASLGAWAIASPVGAAPDDDYHLASIWCSWGEREGLCAETDSASERVVSERLVQSSKCYAQDGTQSAQCALDDAHTITTERGNFVGHYPPVFYSVMGIFSSEDVALSTVLMRLFNALLFVGATATVIALLRPGQRGPIIWTAVVALVPLGMFIIPSVNPSSWSILAGLLVWIACYGYFTAQSRARQISLGAIALVLAVMGAGARGDSAVYVAFAALIAMVLTFHRSKRWLMLAALPLVIIGIGAFFFLSADQATGAASVGVIQGAADAGAAAPAGAAAAAAAAPSALAGLLANLVDLPWLWTGATGTWGLGWLDTPMPTAVWVLMLGVLVTTILWGLRVQSRRKGVLLLMGLAALTVIPLYVLYGRGMRVGAEVQPRYLLPLLIIFVGVALFGFAKDHLGLSRVQAGVVFAAATIANSLAMHNNMRRYISGLGDAGFNLNANIEWWWNLPFSPMLVWLGGSAAFALMLLGLWLWLYPKGERPGATAQERSPELAV